MVAVTGLSLVLRSNDTGGNRRPAGPATTARMAAPSRKAYMSTSAADPVPDRPSGPGSGPGPDLAAIAGALRTAGCVFAEDEAALLAAAAATPADLDDMVRRRAEGLPLEHVLGWAEFCGLRVAVDPGVFVPRRRTQLLAREAAALARPGAVVVDLACGSGAVGLAVTSLAGGAELHAVDIDRAAAACARRNVAPSGGRVYCGDLFGPLPVGLRGRVGVVVANVPYVPSAQVAYLPPEARLHEPRRALDGGADGLDVLRRVAAGAPRWLAADGHLLIEVSAEQAQAAAAAFSTAGLAVRLAADAELGATVVIGWREAAATPF